MTESCSQCTLNPLAAIKIGSSGKPYHTDMAIFADGKYHEYGKENGIKGEICVKGDHVITHYLSGSQKDFQNGWFHTGDLGYFDQDGYLWLDRRIKRLINRTGAVKRSARSLSKTSSLNCLLSRPCSLF